MPATARVVGRDVRGLPGRVGDRRYVAPFAKIRIIVGVVRIGGDIGYIRSRAIDRKH
jgi:hypothetical protein